MHHISYLRKYEVIDRSEQDGWTIETRKRMSGKLKGGTYKVFIAPSGVKHYSLSKAREGGFKGSIERDGRKRKRAGKK